MNPILKALVLSIVGTTIFMLGRTHLSPQTQDAIALALLATLPFLFVAALIMLLRRKSPTIYFFRRRRKKH